MISIIVPALNEEEVIEECMRSLRKQKFRGMYEIILVDGGSRDKTVQLAKPYVNKVIRERGQGPASARNAGVKHAKYGIVAFIDADCIASKEWLETIASDFNGNRGMVGLGGVLRPHEGDFFDNLVFKINSDLWVRFSALFGIVQLYGNNCAYRKKEFEHLGGFNERISFFEDTELSMRMKKIGRMRIDKDLIVYTSVRRFRQKGYLKVAAQNFKAFFNFLLHRPIKERYFAEIKH